MPRAVVLRTVDPLVERTDSVGLPGLCCCRAATFGDIIAGLLSWEGADGVGRASRKTAFVGGKTNEFADPFMVANLLRRSSKGAPPPGPLSTLEALCDLGVPGTGDFPG